MGVCQWPPIGTCWCTTAAATTRGAATAAPSCTPAAQCSPRLSFARSPRRWGPPTSRISRLTAFVFQGPLKTGNEKVASLSNDPQCPTTPTPPPAWRTETPRVGHRREGNSQAVYFALKPMKGSSAQSRQFCKFALHFAFPKARFTSFYCAFGCDAAG